MDARMITPCRELGTLLSFVAVMVVLFGGCRRQPETPPVQEGLRPINGTALYVKRMGAGEPIVIVHGGPVLEHGYLLPHLAPLADSHELIFYDQRLSGRSAPSVDSSSVRLATYVDDIDALRQTLGLDRMHLLGHSWGGLLAMHYALRYQPNLESLMLVSSMPASVDRWQEEERQIAGQLTRRDSLERDSIMATEQFIERAPAAIRELLLFSFKQQFHDRSKIRELELYVPPDYTDRARQFGYLREDLSSFDLYDELASISVPTLVLYGAAEAAVASGIMDLAERIPNSKLVIVGDAGHFPFVEQPERFLRAVRDFLRGS